MDQLSKLSCSITRSCNAKILQITIWIQKFYNFQEYQRQVILPANSSKNPRMWHKTALEWITTKMWRTQPGKHRGSRTSQHHPENGPMTKHQLQQQLPQLAKTVQLKRSQKVPSLFLFIIIQDSICCLLKSPPSIKTLLLEMRKLWKIFGQEMSN